MTTTPQKAGEREMQNESPAFSLPHSPPSMVLPAPLEAVVKRVEVLRMSVVFIYRLVIRWEEDACTLMAAALAFFGLLSMFPLALAGVTILAQFLAADTGALSRFTDFVGSFLPGAAGQNIQQEVARAVRSIAAGPNVTLTSLLAFASLVWAGRAYFDTLATVLNRIFPGSTPRTFLLHQLTLWSLLLGTGLLFVLSSVATFGLSLLQSLAERLPNLFINNAPMLWDFAGKLLSWLLTFLMFFFLYRFTPNRTSPPKRRVVMASALVAMIGWEFGKWGFARFLGNVTRYEAMYGSVAGVVVTMLWIYYASLIVLLGAEVGATWEDLRTAKRQAASEEAMA